MVPHQEFGSLYRGCVRGSRSPTAEYHSSTRHWLSNTSCSAEPVRRAGHVNMCMDASKQEFTTYRHCTGTVIVSVYSHSIIIIMVEYT